MFKNLFYILLIIIFSIYLYKRIKYIQFKGPIPFPVLGNLYDPKAAFVITYINSCINKYGNIFTFWAGPKAMLVVSEPEIVRKILTDTKVFIKGTDYTEKFSVVFGQGLVTSNGEKHRKDRGCLGRFFTQKYISEYNNLICELTDNMIIENILPNIGKIMDIQNFFHILSLRIFGKFSIGIDYSLPENQEFALKLNSGVKQGSNIIGTHIILNIPMLPFLPSVKKLKSIVKNVDNHISDIINKRLELIKNEENCPDDILNTLINRSLRNYLNDSFDYTMKDIHEHIRTALAAGHDTTAFFGCYMTYLLSLYPEIQNKIRTEINKNLSNTDYLSNEDIDKLKYCKCVLKEVLRLYTIIPFINRTCVTKYKIEGTNYVIPANTVILIPLTNMNRSSKIWENPTTFNPDRFIDYPSINIPKKGYFPFGYGSRGCIGTNLAMVEGIIMMVKLVSKFKIYPDPNFKPDIIAGISLISKNGINVRLEKL